MQTKKESAPTKKWSPAPRAMVDLFEKIASTFPEMERRKMFGYPCSFVHGNMCA